MKNAYDVIVIGAGQAGLAAGYYLQRSGIDFAIVESKGDVGGSWQHYWDSLRVFSPARYSQLPGMDFPGDPMCYPGRDEVIAYLRDYSAHFAMPVITGFCVETIRQYNDVFYVVSRDGQCVQARAVIVAAGPFNRPHIPDIPGREHFEGITLHSYDYRRPEPYAGQRVVVVGANNSAVQIGVELAEVADVTLAVRREIEWLPKYFLGRSIFFWIHDTGFDMLPLGYITRLKDSNHVIDDGTYRSAIANGKPATKRMFVQFTPDGVLWTDGKIERIDTVLFATGFRPDNVPFLADIDALADDGQPCQHGGISSKVSGLFYVGVFGQRTPASATLRGVGTDARRIANHVESYLGQ